VFQFADAAVANQLAREPEFFVAALLGAGLENYSIAAHCFDHPFAFVNGQRERLFTVNILFRFDCREIDERVARVILLEFDSLVAML
jgi:hypothetical protein